MSCETAARTWSRWSYKKSNRTMNSNRVVCLQCDEGFEADATPVCPRCLVVLWLAAPRFVRPKHDPRLLPLAWQGYRSVLTPSIASDPRPHLDFAARHGTWYRDNYYEMYVHMTVEPLGRHPGSGIPEGRTTPEHGLDSLLIAEANSEVEAHAFAVSRAVFDEQVRAGEFEALPACADPDCEFISLPGERLCAIHAGTAKRVGS